ncbi:hypothetical protein KIN20_011813 [Parelaphostrongylus tenuis]|uniref:Uncharacterized protein n=1 Tax=Parelaphostrongylus tenuis TaxID=148309 RepID=A0AAD5QLB0_PARTN|nr:hypothetical protein KIN20_011813 [Parelaphostrongylus tenuis]
MHDDLYSRMHSDIKQHILNNAKSQVPHRKPTRTSCPTCFVFDVLESQDRSALQPDAVISSILGPLTINITYEPLECKKVALMPMRDLQELSDRCIIVSNTVTGICTKAGQAPVEMCHKPMAIGAIPPRHLTLGGTISTTNIIIANWSRTVWQSAVNRAVRMLASSELGSNFFSASAVVSGN